MSCASFAAASAIRAIGCVDARVEVEEGGRGLHGGGAEAGVRE